MSIFDTLVKPWARSFAREFMATVYATTDKVKDTVGALSYAMGDQPQQLKVKANQFDDNIIVNKIGKIAAITISQMVGGGVEFRIKGQEEKPGVIAPEKEYLDRVWDANHKEILLHRSVQSGIVSGDTYIEVCDPDLTGAVADRNGEVYPRLLMLNPAHVTMDTLPEDFDIVIRYTLTYKFVGLDGKEKARKKEYEHIAADDDQKTPERWDIVISEETGGKWREVNRINWPYPFCPVVHWQANPSFIGAYGVPDLPEHVLALQNKINASESINFKGHRLGAFPMRWGKGLEGMEMLDTGPDKIVKVGPEGEVNQLPPEIDMPGGVAYAQHLGAELYDVTRTVNISDATRDKAGNVTNFALRVLYQDNKAKIDTKRELMSDGLEEINRRLLLIAGMEAVETETVWAEFVPQNKQEEATYHQTLINIGIESQQSAAEALGLDWEQESDRKEEEAASQDNVGAMVLRAFERGGGKQMPLGERQAE